MSFKGYLINIGNNPTSTSEQLENNVMHFERYIIAQSYHVSKKPLDLDSKRDGDGILRRNVLEHVPYTISFNLRKLNNHEVQDFMNHVRNSFTLAKERKLNLNFYNPEDDDYKTIEVYLVDPDFTIDHIDEEHNEIRYRETQIKFIGY